MGQPDGGRAALGRQTLDQQAGDQQALGQPAGPPSVVSQVLAGQASHPGAPGRPG